MEMEEIPLTGGKTTSGVVKIANTVRRPLADTSPFVHKLLCHLEAVGFEASPRFLGIDEQGREILSYIDGYVPRNLNFWSDIQLQVAAKLIRRFHDATVGSHIAKDTEIVCHNDLSPCNFVFINDIPTAIIDFDAAAPGTRMFDVAYAAWLWLDIGNDEISVNEQRRRLSVFADAYGEFEITSLINVMKTRQQMLYEEGVRRQKQCMANWAKSSLEWAIAHF